MADFVPAAAVSDSDNAFHFAFKTVSSLISIGAIVAGFVMTCFRQRQRNSLQR
jgi:hypothetical protein